MRKVKKGTGLTASRAARATPSRTGGTGRATTGKVAGTPRSPGSAASPAKGAKRKVVARGTSRANPSKGRRAAGKQVPERSIRIRELDPVARCGPGTSVQRLYRVDELLDGAPTAHLVFFDRHGWYCEHGRHCPAVADVRRHGKVHHLFTD